MPGGMFTGRDAELDQLRSAFARARTGTGSTIILAGEPGIGKSRLARVFADEARANGARVIRGQATEGPWTRPFGIWASIFAELTPDMQITADQARALVTLVPELAMRASGSDQIKLDADQERIRLFDTAHQLLVAESTRQVVVIELDDIQWADVGSIELLRHIAWFAPNAALVIIACERTGVPDLQAINTTPLESLRSQQSINLIQVRGLDEEAVANLVGDRWKLDRAEIQTLTTRTGGNPFYIEELLRSSSEPTGVVQTGGESTFDVPATIRHAIERRLSQLSENATVLLNTVALFPTGAEFQVLLAITDIGVDALLDALDEALAVQILVPAHGTSERYLFAHAIVRQTLIERWNPSRRIRLHLRAADAMERIHGDHSGDYSAEIAIQFHNARSLPDSDRGLPFAMDSVLQARRSHASQQLVTMLRVARDLSVRARPAIRADILGQLAVAEAEAVRVEAAIATQEDFLLEADRAGIDALMIAAKLNEFARALKYSAYAEERFWRPVVERGLAITTPDDGLVWARLMLLLDPVEPLSRSGIKAGRWLGFDERAIAILRSTGNEDDFARSVESFDAISRSETDAYLTRIRGFSTPAAIMYGLTVAANHLQYRHGAFRDAHRIWLELAQRSEQAGAMHWEQQATNQLTYLLIAEGKFAEAIAFEDRSNALAERLGPGQHSEGHQLEMATCRAIYQGTDWPEIATAWRAILDDPAFGPHDLATLTGAFYAALAAYCAAQADDHATALRLLELLDPILARMTAQDCNQNGTIGFAVGAAWSLKYAGSAPMYRQLASELIAAGSGDYPQTSLYLALGQAQALLGRIDDARAAFALGRRTVTESGQDPMIPIIDFTEAEALFHCGHASAPEVKPLLDRARAGFDAYGMTPWLIDHQVLSESIEASGGKGLALPGSITEREADVLRLITRGFSDRQISEELFVSPRTVNAHVRNMLSKTAVSNRVELAMWARSNGIVPE